MLEECHFKHPSGIPCPSSLDFDLATLSNYHLPCLYMCHYINNYFELRGHLALMKREIKEIKATFANPRLKSTTLNKRSKYLKKNSPRSVRKSKS